MNYIYDIYINLLENYYDSYEWEKTDKIIHLKKIPIIKINKKDYQKLLTNKFKIDKELYKKIKYKTKLWDNKNNTLLLITNGLDIFIIKLNNEGMSTLISSLPIDEELNIINIIKKIETKKINYKLIQRKKIFFKTRNELEITNKILSNIKKLSPIKDINKINYIYYDCFTKTEKKKKKALIKIIKNINNQIILIKLHNFFELTKTK